MPADLKAAGIFRLSFGCPAFLLCVFVGPNHASGRTRHDRRARTARAAQVGAEELIEKAAEIPRTWLCGIGFARFFNG